LIKTNGNPCIFNGFISDGPCGHTENEPFIGDNACRFSSFPFCLFLRYVKKRGSPVEVVKIGGFSAPIYWTPLVKGGREYPGFTARFKDGNGSRRIYRASIDELRGIVKALVTPMANGKADCLVLRGPERAIYERSVKEAIAIGMEADQAVAELKRIKSMAQEATCSVEDAIKFWSRHHAQTKQAIPIPEAVDAFLDHMLRSGNSTMDLRDLRVHLGWFTRRFKCPLRDVTADDYDSYFASFKVSPVTLRHYRGSVARFVNWARRSRFVPHDYPGVLSDPSHVKHRTKREPLLSQQDRDRMILKAHEIEFAAALIAAYAPIRTCELDRASFEDINWSNSTIAVYADDAKTGATRFIYLVPDLMRKLQPFKNHSGKISPYKSLSRFWPRLARKADVPWRKNGWRKAVLSYLVAYTQNFEGVAGQAGTSVKQLKNTYVTAVPFETGAAWFNLMASDFHPLRPVSFLVSMSGQPGALPQDAVNDGSKIVPFAAVVAAR
jgi:integrase